MTGSLVCLSMICLLLSQCGSAKTSESYPSNVSSTPESQIASDVDIQNSLEVNNQETTKNNVTASTSQEKSNSLKESIEKPAEKDTSNEWNESVERLADKNIGSGWEESVEKLAENETGTTQVKVELHRAGVNHDQIEDYAEMQYDEIEAKLKELDLYVDTNLYNDVNTRIDDLTVRLQNDVTGQRFLHDFTIGLMNCDDLVVQDALDSETFQHFLDEAWYNPELISWTINKPDEPEGYCEYIYDPSQDYIGMHPNYYADKETCYNMSREMFEKQINIAQWGLYNSKNIDEYAQYLVCYLKTNSEYDYEGIDSNYLSKIAYGPIVEEKGICQGYAKAFSYLMNLAGYKSTIVLGYYGDILHGWNAIEDSQGNKVYIDVTTGVSSDESWDWGYNIQFGDKYKVTDELDFEPTEYYLNNINILEQTV